MIPMENNELERYNKLISVSRCRNTHDVPRAVEAWEADWAIYKGRTGEDLPERLKTHIMLKMAPTKYEEEVRLRYSQPNVDYANLRLQIFDYAMRKSPAVSRPLHPLDDDDDFDNDDLV